MINIEQKFCNGCKNTFPQTLEFWPPSKRTKNGLNTPCRNCCKSYSKIRRSNPESKEKDKKSYQRWLKKNPKISTKNSRRLKFGITPEGYDVLFKNQNGVCAICGQMETAKIRNVYKSLAVDHCHTSKKIRGLLCSKCNTAIGLVNDNVDILLKMVDYLKNK